jgi:hypothetical protein
MKWNGTATSITGIATVVALAFGAWFAVMGAIAGESEKLQSSITGIELQQQAEDVDFAIYQVTHKMDVIDARIDNGTAYANDRTQLKLLKRSLNVLLRRQDVVLKRIESSVK